ncbi:hypothetical protein C8R45DRAFT_846438 [Mycena sanguinolenta]|nr:hypothetical protein C8R45DRAFT_846438 [Mycena sanguinolenta]
MLASTLFALLAAGVATAAPLAMIRDVSLDPVATAEAQKFDATATRALTGTTITTSDGKCFSVDPFSGDFRENLTPVNVVACNGSKNQTWDVITSGVHNNVPGQALIVSSLTNACLIFDPRRAAGNQVLLFSCGGRADGSGQIATSQLFDFNGNTGPQALVPQNGNNAICLTVINNLVDQTSCNGAASASGEEVCFPTTAATTAATDATTTTDAATTTDATTTTDAATTTTTDAVTTTSATATGPIAVSGAGGTLNPTAVSEAQPKDTTATFAATGAQIKTSDGQCLSIDATAGDFRENLIPINVKACDGSEGQKFDFITKGVHNNQAGQTLIVSSLTNGCFNFDSRRAAGDQVILFSCGGRADGGGQVTNSQLFPFVNANLTAPYALTPSNAPGVCFVNTNGRLTNVNCDTSNPTANECLHFPLLAESLQSFLTLPTMLASSLFTLLAAGSVIAVPFSRRDVTLDAAATAEAQKFDSTATRALTGTTITTSDGKCLSVDPLSGDFRENLTPVNVVACDGSKNQTWDVITAGVHNNVPGQALIVSSLTNACLNFDARRAPGNQVLLFSCGGRADGSGQVTNSQLFPFTAGNNGPQALLPQSGNNATCLTVINGLVDQTACSGAASATGLEVCSFIRLSSNVWFISSSDSCFRSVVPRAPRLSLLPPPVPRRLRVLLLRPAARSPLSL